MSTSAVRNGAFLQRLILAPQRRVPRPLASATTSRTHCADAAVRNSCKTPFPKGKPQEQTFNGRWLPSPQKTLLGPLGLINPFRSPFPPHPKTHLLIMWLSRGQDSSMCVVSPPLHLPPPPKKTPPSETPNRTTEYFANRTHGMIDVFGTSEWI